MARKAIGVAVRLAYSAAMHDGLAGSAPLLLGLALGMRHAFDPDHIVAMSTMVSRERSIARAALLGGAWGSGHCLSLLAVGLAVILFRVPMPQLWGPVFERLVGVMLVVLGVTSLLWRGTPGAQRHASSRPLVVGLVHGLAGSGALAIAVLATIPSRAAGLLYIALFGAGAIGGMMLITALIAVPMRFAARGPIRVGRWLPAVASVGSVVFGIWYLYQNA